MKIAFFSDVYSNVEALSRVLKDMNTARGGPDYLPGGGDNVGYGLDPCGMLQLLRAHGVVFLLGNHELALLDPDYPKKVSGKNPAGHHGRCNPHPGPVYFKNYGNISPDPFIWGAHPPGGDRYETGPSHTPSNRKKILFLDKPGRYIINAGSVGQSRDGDASARYLLWGVKERTVEFRRVAHAVTKPGL